MSKLIDKAIRLLVLLALLILVVSLLANAVSEHLHR